MKAIPSILCLLVFGLCAILSATEPTIAQAKPQDGVFFSYTGYTTTVLELKNGRFRYWWESTEIEMPKHPVYPNYWRLFCFRGQDHFGTRWY